MDHVKRIIYDVFVRSFGRETFDKSEEECAIIAEAILRRKIRLLLNSCISYA